MVRLGSLFQILPKVEGDEFDARYATYQSIVVDYLGLVQSDYFIPGLVKCLSRFKAIEIIGLLHCPLIYLLDPRRPSSLSWLSQLEESN